MRQKMPAPPLKTVIWLGGSLRELKAFPAAVQDEIAMPKADIELITRRLKQAVAISYRLLVAGLGVTFSSVPLAPSVST